MSAFGNGTAQQEIYEAIEGALRYNTDGDPRNLSPMAAVQLLMIVIERIIQEIPYWFNGS